MASQFASFLTSPTIRLIPNPPASQPCTDTQYIVHRALLTSKSPHLKRRTRESYILLENTTEETVGLFLEWLYRGDYDIPASAIDEQEEEVEEQHPVVAAAMAGCVGVWGYNKPLVVGRSYLLEKSRSEGLQSKYVTFGADGQVSVIGVGSEPIQLPSPPISPKVEHCKPNPTPVCGSLPSPNQEPTTVSIHLDPPPAEAQHKSCAPIVTIESVLAAHLALYAFSVRFQIVDLNQQALFKISAFLETHSPPADSLVCFIRGVYYDSEETGNIAGLTRGSPLREFVAKYVAYRLEEVKSSPGFKKLLGQGGDFTVDLVQCVMGDSGSVWVK